MYIIINEKCEQDYGFSWNYYYNLWDEIANNRIKINI